MLCGATAITVDAGASFLVGDIIKFGSHSQLYDVTGISSNTLTIKRNQSTKHAGLSKCSCDNEQVDRYWEHYALFDKGIGTSANAYCDRRIK